MRPKVVVLARVKDGNAYPFLPVEIKRGRPIPVEGATGYYLRFTEHKKRKVEPVGVNLDLAFIAFQNRELNLTRRRLGLAPIHGPAGLVQDFKDHANNRVRISDTVKKYIEDLEASVETCSPESESDA